MSKGTSVFFAKIYLLYQKRDSAIRYQNDRLRHQKHRFNEALDNKIREIVREALDSNSHS